MRLASWLAARGHALAPGAALTPLAGGLANRNERVELAGGPAVLRRPPPGPLAAGANDMARECRVLAALAHAFPLSPRVLAFEDDPALLGTPFLLLEWRPGVAIRDVPPPGVAANWLAGETIRRMAALHALDPVAIGLGDLGRPEGFYARQLAGWTARATAAWPAGPPVAAARLIAALGAAAAPPEGAPVLLHMDLKPDNLLVDPAIPVVTAVIDWDMATRGPRAFDLAVLLSYCIAPDDPVEVRTLRATPSLEPGWPGRADLVAAYAAASGVHPAPLDWPLALARLRLAVAWMQLYRKWERGELHGARYAGFATLALAILEHAADQLEDARP